MFCSVKRHAATMNDDLITDLAVTEKCELCLHYNSCSRASAQTVTKKFVLFTEISECLLTAEVGK